LNIVRATVSPVIGATVDPSFGPVPIAVAAIAIRRNSQGY
jgi:hypothetical protein